MRQCAITCSTGANAREVVIEAAMIAPPVTSPRTVRYAPNPRIADYRVNRRNFETAVSFEITSFALVCSTR